jgi:putative peptidoglycan lipid II flippase
MNSALLYFTLSRRIHGIEGRKTAATVAKILLASAAMAAVSFALNAGIERALGQSFTARAISVSASVIAGAAVFYYAAYLLNVEELKSAASAISRRFLKRS